jgi:hypothetical protein
LALPRRMKVKRGIGAAWRRGCRKVSVGAGHITFSPQPSSEVSAFRNWQLSWALGGGTRLSLSPEREKGAELSGLGIFHLGFCRVCLHEVESLRVSDSNVFLCTWVNVHPNVPEGWGWKWTLIPLVAYPPWDLRRGI